jgi:GntR family transcriptional regulator
VDIRISKESSVPLREQIAAQIEFLIATGKLKPGAPLPSVRTLARRLDVHHNTVSQAYREVTGRGLIAGNRGQQLRVGMAERALMPQPDLDDLINQTIRLARQHGYSLQELSTRVRERLNEETPDHILVLSYDAGMRRLLKAEVVETVKCNVTFCSPQDLITNPELAIGALVVSPPGVLPAIREVLPKDRPAISILYSSAESQLQLVRKLSRPSLVAVVSVSADFLKVARGLLASVIGPQHTLLEGLVSGTGTMPIPACDLLFCDAIVHAGLCAARRRRNCVEYRLISPECLCQIVARMPTSSNS